MPAHAVPEAHALYVVFDVRGTASTTVEPVLDAGGRRRRFAFIPPRATRGGLSMDPDGDHPELFRHLHIRPFLDHALWRSGTTLAIVI